MIATHLKKLLNLWRKQSANFPRSVINISKQNVTLKETNALQFGLNHHITPKRIQKDKIKVNIEKLIHKIKGKAGVICDEIKGELCTKPYKN